MGDRTLDMRQQALEFSEDQTKIAANLMRFANALKERIAALLPDKEIVIVSHAPGTIDFNTAPMDRVYIKLPMPQNCFKSYVYSPLANKYDYRFQYWSATDKFLYKDKPALVSGASIIFVVFAHMKLLDEAGFDEYLKRFVGNQEVNLFRYAEQVQRMYVGRQRNVQSNIDTLNADIAVGERELQARYLERRNLQDQLSLVNGSIATWVERIKGDLDRLAKLSPARYSSFTYASSGCVVSAYTTPVRVSFQDHEYDLGYFKVDVDFGNRTLKIKNQDQTKILQNGAYHHPHITNNNVCLGNMVVSVNNMITDFEIFGVFLTLHNYLCSYNPGNPYHRIENWPLVNPTTTILEDGNLSDEDLDALVQEEEAERRQARETREREAEQERESRAVHANVTI